MSMLTRLGGVHLSDEDEISDMQGSCAFSPFPKNGLVELDAASIAAVFNSRCLAHPLQVCFPFACSSSRLLSPIRPTKFFKLPQSHTIPNINRGPLLIVHGSARGAFWEWFKRP